MRAQKSEAATKDRPGRVALVGSARSAHTKNRSNPQSNCAPEVVVYRRGGSVFVALANRPWGWPNPDKQFFDAGAAERYAARLKGKLAAAAKKEADRRERQWQARLEERAALLEKGGAR